MLMDMGVKMPLSRRGPLMDSPSFTFCTTLETTASSTRFPMLPAVNSRACTRGTPPA